MILYLIRHGETLGNTQKRYVGRTDEPITREAEIYLSTRAEKILSTMDVIPKEIYVSPMLRCRQTANIIFPNARQVVIDELCECDFGEFEYKNYLELAENENYKQFVESNGKTAFPDGEDKAEFIERSVSGFEKALSMCKHTSPMVLVVHGGTIMSILDSFSQPHRDYFDWQIKNGDCYRASLIVEDEVSRLCGIELL